MGLEPEIESNPTVSSNERKWKVMNTNPDQLWVLLMSVLIYAYDKRRKLTRKTWEKGKGKKIEGKQSVWMGEESRKKVNLIYLYYLYY